MVVGKDSLLALIFPMPENSTDTIMQRSDNIGVRQLRTEQNEVENELSSYIDIASYIMIGVGALIMILTFFGIFGAIKETRCLLLTYAAVVIITTLAQSTGIILAAVYQDLLREHIQVFFTQTA